MAIASEPSAGADIYLNGKKQALKTDALFKSLRPGRYEIKLVGQDAEDGQPQTGKAAVEVRTGLKTNVVIRLNRMEIVPAAGNAPLLPESAGQKAILDFFAALSARDVQKAFNSLTPKAKRAAGGYWRFGQSWRDIETITVTDLEKAGPETSKAVEINRVKLQVRRRPPQERDRPVQAELSISTVEEISGSGIVKIDSTVTPWAGF